MKCLECKTQETKEAINSFCSRKCYLLHIRKNPQTHYNYRHGKYGTPIYLAWRGMKSRCFNPKNKRYSRYGGRGITVCERWLDFRKFEEDMSPTWRKGLQLERINNNGNYELPNCRWATIKEQARNRSNNYQITHKGKTMCISDWEKALGFKDGTLRMRLRYYGWSVEQALSIKPKQGQKINI